MKIRKRMSAEEAKRALEYREGDIVQIRPDGYEHSGRLGMIIGINVYKQKSGKPYAFSYRIKLSSNESVAAPCNRIRLVREADSSEDIPEEKSHFLPVRSWRY